MRHAADDVVLITMGIRVVVAIVIITPLMVAVGWPHPWYLTFGIAMLGFGAGHLVEHLVESGKQKTRP